MQPLLNISIFFEKDELLKKVFISEMGVKIL